MASFSKSGSVSSAVGLNTNPSVSLSGSGSANGIIDSVIASIYMSTTAYSKTYDVTATLHYAGGSVQAGSSIKFSSGNASGASFSFYFPTGFDVNSISSISVSCSSSGNTIFLKNEQTVTVNYTTPSNVGAPTSVSLATAVTTAATNTLNWSGAKAGTANSITGYKIQYCDMTNGSWGSWIDYAIVSSSSTSESRSVDMPAVGVTRKFRVLTQGSAGSNYYSGYIESGTAYRAYTPTAPANLLPAAGAYVSMAAISWGAVTCTDTIAGYEYQISTNGGSAWGSAITTTALSINFDSIFFTAAVSVRFMFRVRAYTNKGIYSSYANSAIFYRTAAPTAPTVLTALPSPYESGPLTLSWSGASDEDNNIAAYDIQQSTSANGSAWTEYENFHIVATSATSGTYEHNPTIERGTYQKYRIRARDALGLVSIWKESNTVYRPLTATAPGNLYPVGGHFENAPVLSWGASTAPDGTIAGYEYQISTNGGSSWGAPKFTEATTAALAEFAAAPRGTAFVFRVRAKTGLGAFSDYAQSEVFFKNTAPTAPAILTPISNKQVYGSGAWAIISCTAKTNSIPQTLEYMSGSGAWLTLAQSVEGDFIYALKLTKGDTYSFRIMDDAGATIQSTVNFLLAAQTYTDTQIIAGTTPTRAAHILEMRKIVASLCLAYGLAAPAWVENIEAGTTSLRHFNAHITELRQTAQAIANKLNGLAGRSVVSLSTWTALSDSSPRADAITGLRSAIAKL